MAVKFQAGVGPDQKRVHIYELEQPEGLQLSLCKRVNVARNYRADLVLHHQVMCFRCATLFIKHIKSEFDRLPVPEDCGVSEITL